MRRSHRAVVANLPPNTAGGAVVVASPSPLLQYRTAFSQRRKKRWHTSSIERQFDAQQRKHASQQRAFSDAAGAGSGFHHNRNIVGGGRRGGGAAVRPTMATYLATLMQDDPTGYTTSDPAALAHAPALNGLTGVTGSIVGPTPADKLLPWLSAPAGRRTYLHQSELSFGRKERWDRVVADPAMRRQLVDTLWMYITDAEKQAALVRKEARHAMKIAQRNSGEFKYWINEMQQGRRGVDAFFDWPEGGGGNRMVPAATSSSSASASQQGGVDGEQQEGDNNNTSSSSSSSAEERKMKRLVRKHRAVADIGSDEPLAPYEELPFLRQRMEEDPASLDPSIQEWARKNFEDLSSSGANNSNQADGGQEGRDDVVSMNDADLPQDGADEQKQQQQQLDGGEQQDAQTTDRQQPTQQQNMIAAKKQAQRLRRLERHRSKQNLFMPLKQRVQKRRPTFDEEGMYFHVTPPPATPSSSSATTTPEEDTMMAAGSPDTKILKRFFRPRMVRANDSTSRGVVKVDWPTVRAAYGGRRKTDLSREEVLAAKERIVRLCRGEDPSSL